MSVVKPVLFRWLATHLVENLHRFVELYIPQERGQVLEEINQQLCVHGPTLEDIMSNKIITQKPLRK